MLEKTVTLGSISFTVAAETGNDFIVKRVLYAKLATKDDTEWQKSWLFIRILAQSKNVTVPFYWPVASDDVETLKQARDALFNLRGKVIKAWDDAIDEVELAPVSDPDLLPPKMIAEKKDESQSSPQSEMNIGQP